ncbi:MAG: recombination-associated protein RdgC [Gammaproteobacteria bacterium]|nr:recombination-associated protein RdgC [Gammaproteobacteria bacterium]
MWFRNARPYKLPGRLGIDASELSQRLSRRPFQPCRPSQAVSSGWVAALSDDATDFVHKSGDYWLIRLQREERLLPASVIRSEVNSRIQEIQTGQGRRVQRKERLDIADEVTQDLMPRAFTKSQYLEALINDREGWMWVNTASAGRAEDLLSLLREGLGNLPVAIPDTQKSPVIVMSQWLLNGGLPEGMSLGGDVDLEDPQEEGGVVRVRGMYLESDEIRRHIESGKQVVRLALSWQDQIDFVVDRDLSLRRIRFSDELKGVNEELHEDVLARRDADCLLMGETLSTLQSAIAKTFGGISE